MEDTEKTEISQTENTQTSEATTEIVEANTEAAAETPVENATESVVETAKKKKRPLPLKILLGFLWTLAGILLIIIGFAVFSALDRAKPLEFLPENYTAVIHTDNIFEAAAPIVELKAADTMLAEQQFSQFRGAFMSARDFFNSSNSVLDKILSRRVDIAVYPEQEGGFVAVFNLSYLSSATRILNIVAPHIDFQNFPIKKELVKNLSFEENHFKYDMGEGNVFHIKFYKNLAIVSASQTLFTQAVSNTRTPSEEEKELIEGKKTNSIRIIANAKKITDFILEGNNMASEVVPLIKDDAFTSVQFSLSNDDIDLQMRLPLVLSDGTPISKLLGNISTTPKLLSLLTSETQYYTMLNIGSLADVKEAAFQIMRQTQDIEGIWKKANTLCKMGFGLSLEDIFFSWTGEECVAMGIEGSSEPVFALQIENENKRREVFEKLDKSMLLNSNTSLIVGGMRLPCFELPPLLASLLSAFGITLPRPYYLVQNGFVYFSMSPQNLSAIYTHSKQNYIISRNENWKRVSQNSSANTSIEIFYNLKRSLPFFIDNGSLVARILKLYSIGRCDIALDGSTIGVHLHASSVTQDDSKQVPGFPISVGKPSDFILHADSKEKPQNVFWLENEGATIKALNLGSLEQHSFEMKEPCYITVIQEKPKSKSKCSACLWAITLSGNIYLFDKDLQCLEGYPYVSGIKVSAPGVAYDEAFFFPSNEGIVYFVSMGENDSKDALQQLSIPDANFKSAPSILGDTMAIYNRKFEGEIYILEKGEVKNKDAPLLVEGLGFGSPCIANNDKKTQIAFITQSGTFYLFENGQIVEGFPLEIDDVFYTNVVHLEGAYFALSEHAVLYKITKNGKVIGVQLPATPSAKEGIIYAFDGKENAGVYASGDNNIIYGFNSSLELLLSFPLAGRGRPVFADVNNDKKIDCMNLSISRELNTWNLN